MKEIEINQNLYKYQIDTYFEMEDDESDDIQNNNTILPPPLCYLFLTKRTRISSSTFLNKSQSL